jgi:hypothetical protein
MDEIEMLTRLRDEVPRDAPSAGAVRMFAEGLAREQAGAPARRRRAVAHRQRRVRQPGWRLALAGGLAAALAAGATGTALWPSSPAARSAAGTPVLTVSDLAYLAATAAARQPAVRPGQWVYRDLYTGQRTPFLPAGQDRHWATADNSVNAFYLHGRLIVGRWTSWAPLGCVAPGKPPRPPVPCAPGKQKYLKFPLPHLFVSYQQLGALPASPRALVTALANRNPHGYVWDMGGQPGAIVALPVLRSGSHGRTVRPGTSRSFRAFNVISYLLSTYVMTPGLTAELYRALGDIPGVKVAAHATDIAGQHGIGFALPTPGSPGQAEAIILNPRTYRLMAFGNQNQGTAVLRQAFVSGPGATPSS